MMREDKALPFTALILRNQVENLMKIDFMLMSGIEREQIRDQALMALLSAVAQMIDEKKP